MAEHESVSERGPDVIAPPPLLYLIPLVAGLLLDRRLPLPRLPRGVRLSGLPLLAGGLGLLGGFVAAMFRALEDAQKRAEEFAREAEAKARAEADAGR